MFKRTLLLLLCIGTCLLAESKPLPYFMKKYHLPDNVNVLSVLGTDCVNCYYGFSFFLKAHSEDFKKKDFVFLFQKNSENEIANIFQYRLELDQTGCNVIVDDDFYKTLNTKSVTTLTIIENKKVKEEFISKDIYKFKSFANAPAAGKTYELMQTDTIDLKARFGTKNISVAILNPAKVIVRNKYTNAISLFDMAQRKTIRQLPLTFFSDKYDSLLSIVLADKPDNLRYNLEHYKTNDFYKTYPLCKIKKVSCVEQSVYVGLSLSRMVPDANNHITYESAQLLVKLDSNLHLQQLYKLLDSVPNVAGKYISLLDYSFINADTVAFSLSAVGDRKKDSVGVLYALKTNETKIINLSYEPFMPLKGDNGYYNYYHFEIWKYKNTLMGNYNKSPFVYHLSAANKQLLPGLGVDAKSIDINGKDKFFWISKIFPYQNSMLVIIGLKQNEMCLLQYDATFEHLISKKKIFDGYLDDVTVIGNRVFSFENYSEKGDVGVLHVYELR